MKMQVAATADPGLSPPTFHIPGKYGGYGLGGPGGFSGVILLLPIPRVGGQLLRVERSLWLRMKPVLAGSELWSQRSNGGTY